MVAPIHAQFCATAAYLQSLRYLDSYHINNFTTAAISVAGVVDPLTTSPDEWSYFGNTRTTIDQISVTIECPIPICQFPISSSFGLLRRLIFYLVLIGGVSRFQPLERLARAYLQLAAILSTFYVASIAFDFAKYQLWDGDLLPAFFVNCASHLYVVLDPHSLDEDDEDERDEDDIDHPPRAVWRYKAMLSREFFASYGCLLFFVFLFGIYARDDQTIPVRILRGNNGSYRIASPCFKHGEQLALWDGTKNFAGRSMRHLLVSSPSDYVHTDNLEAFLRATGLASVAPIGLSSITIGYFSIIGVMVFLLPVMRTTRDGPQAAVNSRRSLPLGRAFCHIPKWLAARFPQYFESYLDPEYELKYEIGYSLFTLFYGVFPWIGLITYAIALERGLGRGHTAVEELPKDFGQWGPFVALWIIVVVLLWNHWRAWKSSREGRIQLQTPRQTPVNFQSFLHRSNPSPDSLDEE